MITGDHGATAQTIAAQFGIGVDNRRCWPDRAGNAGRRGAAGGGDGHRRVSPAPAPEHKLRLVAALQDNRQVVAMTGDGVNDAPAPGSAPMSGWRWG